MGAITGLLALARRGSKKPKMEAPNEPTSLFGHVGEEWIDPPEIEIDPEWALRQRINELTKTENRLPWYLGGAGYGGYWLGQRDREKK